MAGSAEPVSPWRWLQFGSARRASAELSHPQCRFLHCCSLNFCLYFREAKQSEYLEHRISDAGQILFTPPCKLDLLSRKQSNKLMICNILSKVFKGHMVLLTAHCMQTSSRIATVTACLLHKSSDRFELHDVLQEGTLDTTKKVHISPCFTEPAITCRQHLRILSGTWHIWRTSQ